MLKASYWDMNLVGLLENYLAELLAMTMLDDSRAYLFHPSALVDLYTV